MLSCLEIKIDDPIVSDIVLSLIDLMEDRDNIDLPADDVMYDKYLGLLKDLLKDPFSQEFENRKQKQAVWKLLTIWLSKLSSLYGIEHLIASEVLNDCFYIFGENNVKHNSPFIGMGKYPAGNIQRNYYPRRTQLRYDACHGL